MSAKPPPAPPAQGGHLSLDYLPDDPRVVRTLATWHHGAWGHLTGRSVEIRAQELQRQVGSRQVPLTVVAWLGGVPVGAASLLAEDMHTHRDLTPWLASVFVDAAHRRRGIGERLCRRIVEEARRLGLPRLYLFTEDQAPFYARMGWLHMAEEAYRGERVTLMRMEVAGAPGVS